MHRAASETGCDGVKVRASRRSVGCIRACAVQRYAHICMHCAIDIYMLGEGTGPSYTDGEVCPEMGWESSEGGGA